MFSLKSITRMPDNAFGSIPAPFRKILKPSFPFLASMAISNVTGPEDIQKYLKLTPSNITIVPKIESRLGIENIESIINELRGGEKIIMLDHDDLYSDLIKNDISSEQAADIAPDVLWLQLYRFPNNNHKIGDDYWPIEVLN